MSDSEDLTRVVTEEKKREFDDTKKVLDELRRTRAARGGVGAPLIIPAHLRQAIIITDADIPRRK